MKFYRNEQIEQIAEQRLLDFERKLAQPLSLPVDVELFGELVLELSILWEDIEELPGEEVLAGLIPVERLIVMNDRRRHEMEEKPGRCRLTQGHEMGLCRQITVRSAQAFWIRACHHFCLSEHEKWAGPDHSGAAALLRKRP
jgi:hypothetical protein